MAHDCAKSTSTCHRCNGSVDNQLGLIHNNLKLVSGPIKFVPYDSNKYKNVFIATDVINYELADNVRSFLQKIPFDKNTIPRLNDTDVQPKTTVVTESRDPIKITEAVDDPVNDPNCWTWEYYITNGAYRAVPLSLKSFVGSPIKKLIDQLESKWLATNFFGMAIQRKVTWVLQMMIDGFCMGPHTDEFSSRKIAFIYYLTEDNWPKNNGELVVYGEPEIYLDPISRSYSIDNWRWWNHIRIDPTFNTMVAWKLGDGTSPIHHVNRVTDKKRFALVGFFN